MASDRENKTFEKTSFLQGSNSPFIEDLYLKYLENPTSIPQSWKQFFDCLDEDKEAIEKEILAPSWAPKRKNNLKVSIEEKKLTEDQKNIVGDTLVSQKSYNK